MRKYFPYYKKNIKLALPIVLSQLGQIIVQQADIMMVGYVGTTELAAIAFANAIFIFGLIFIVGFSLGLTPAVGHIEDKKNYSKLSELLSNGLLVNILATVLFMTGLFITSFFFDRMGQEAEVVHLAKPYFYTLVISMFPLAIFYTQKQFAEGIGDTKNAMYVILSANVVNIVLNYILIFGKLGLPEYGILGAGIATLISRIYMVIVYTIIFKRNSIFRPIFERVRWHLIDVISIKKLMNLGIPISIQLVLEVAAFALSGVMAGWIGVTALAAHQVGASISSMSFMLSIGVGAATTIRVSHQFAAQNYKGLIMAATASKHIIILFMLITGLSFYIFRHHLPHFYTQDIEVIKRSSMILIAVAIYQIFDGIQVIMISILRGLGDVKHAMLYSFIAYIIINLPVAYILAFYLNLGVIGLWIGFIFGLGIAALLFYSRIRVLYSRFPKNINASALGS